MPGLPMAAANWPIEKSSSANSWVSDVPNVELLAPD
jgi:hypothetical protein